MIEHTLFSMLAYYTGTMLVEMNELFLLPSESKMNNSGQWTGSLGTNAEARASGKIWYPTWVTSKARPAGY